MKKVRPNLYYISLILLILSGITACGEEPTKIIAATTTVSAIPLTSSPTSPEKFATVTPARQEIQPMPTEKVSGASPTPTLLHSADYPPTPTLPPPTPTSLPGVNSSGNEKIVLPTTPARVTGALPNTIKGTLTATINAFPKAVATLAWSPNGQILAAASRDTKTIGLWNGQGQSLGTLNSGGSPATNQPPFYANLAWSPDGKILAAALNDTVIQLWGFSLGGSAKLLTSLTGHTLPVTSLAWSPDGNTLASGSTDSTVRLWDSTGKARAVLKGHTGVIPRLAWSPDGKTLASEGGERPGVPQPQQDSTIRLWSVDGKLLGVLDGGPDNWFIDMAWSPDGQILAASDILLSKIYFWNRLGEPLTTFWAAQEETGQIAWSPDSKTLATCGGDEQTRLWDWQGQQVGSLSEANKNVCDVAWSPDGKVIATAFFGPPDYVSLWSADGRKIATLDPPSTAETSTYLVWSPDGKTLVVGYNDGTIRMWK